MVLTCGFVRPFDLVIYPIYYIEITGNKVSEKLIHTS